MVVSAQMLVAEARAGIVEVDVAEAQRRLAAGAVAIDVREPAEFAVGHLDGAANIPRGVLEFEVLASPAVGGVTADELSVRERALVLYCRSGGRAALAAANLVRMGFGNVCSIAGGIMAWEAAGCPITTKS